MPSDQLEGATPQLPTAADLAETHIQALQSRLRSPRAQHAFAEGYQEVELW